MTIHDVAREAGVSIKTVSRVANQEANVRPATRERVQQVIETLQYRPNPSARSLAGTRSYLVGLLYDNPSAYYLVNIQNGVLKTSREQGYDLVIHPCDYRSPKLGDEISELVNSAQVDGLILTPPITDLVDVVAALREQDIPFVRVAPADTDPDNPAVYTNDREACAEMTRYLHSLGHKRIGFVIGHPDHGAVAHRYQGYLDGLRDSGLTPDEALVQQGYNSFDSGVDSARALLARDKPPTAIFASNDDMAAGVMRAAAEMNLSVPQDLSIAGFDDTPLASQVWPALTTIHQPINEMAQTATRLLLRRLRERDTDDIDTVIRSSLVIRASTGPAPGSDH